MKAMTEEINRQIQNFFDADDLDQLSSNLRE